MILAVSGFILDVGVKDGNAGTVCRLCHPGHFQCFVVVNLHCCIFYTLEAPQMSSVTRQWLPPVLSSFFLFSSSASCSQNV